MSPTTLPDRLMRSLDAIAHGCEFSIVDDARMVVVLPGGLGGWEVTGEELDELLRREWVVVSGDEITATEAGRYWLGRWAGRRVRQRAAYAAGVEIAVRQTGGTA